MLVFQTQISQNTTLAVWQIVESETFFWDSLRLLAEDEAKIKNIKLQQVRLQKLACRAVLAELIGNNEVGITYTETGQPQIKDYCISFSHTKNSVAVAVSNIPVGIDIEELTPRILKLYPRFMSPQEIDCCNLDNLQELYYYWCAKEAMYKWVATKNVDFIKDLQVYKNENKGVVCNQHALRLITFLQGNRFIVVCCVPTA
jgi:phosphopantetheinyl transferase